MLDINEYQQDTTVLIVYDWQWHVHSLSAMCMTVRQLVPLLGSDQLHAEALVRLRDIVCAYESSALLVPLATLHACSCELSTSPPTWGQPSAVSTSTGSWSCGIPVHEFPRDVVPGLAQTRRPCICPWPQSSGNAVRLSAHLPQRGMVAMGHAHPGKNQPG